MIILIFSEPVWRWWATSRVQDFSSDRRKLDSLIALWDVESPIHTDAVEKKGDQQTFLFNPNTASAEELQALGFSKNVAERIGHYLEKGGVFRAKPDVLKIYGVDSMLYLQLYSFIDLPERTETKKVFEQIPQAFTKKSNEKFDLNVADTTQLKRIYGIGEKLSLRIIKYRNALGGFITMDQLKEVYGLDSAVVNRLIKASYVERGFVPSKININTIGEKELATHPYLSNKEARAIVAYRFQHGEFKAFADIENILGVDSETIRKIEPYLKFND